MSLSFLGGSGPAPHSPLDQVPVGPGLPRLQPVQGGRPVQWSGTCGHLLCQALLVGAQDGQPEEDGHRRLRVLSQGGRARRHCRGRQEESSRGTYTSSTKAN